MLNLHLDYYREDHRTALNFLVEERANFISNTVLVVILVNATFKVALEDFTRERSRVLNKLLVFFHVDEAARDEIGVLHQLTVLFVDGDNDDDHTVSCHHLSITEHDVRNVTDAETVDEYIVGWYAFVG